MVSMRSQPATNLSSTVVPLPAQDGDYRTLVGVLLDLSRGVDLPSTFQAVANGLLRLAPFDWLCLAYQGPRQGDLLIHRSLSGRPEWLATSEAIATPSEPVQRWFLPSEARLKGPDTLSEDSAALDWPVPGDINSLITIPLPASGGGSRRDPNRQQRRGALMLGRSGNERFAPGLVSLLVPCAAQVGLLLEKAEWLSRFRATNEELRQQVQVLQRDSKTQRQLPSSRGQGEQRRDEPLPESHWLGVDPSSIDALEQAKRAATTEISVLLHGESGTGKELLARLIHRASSRSVGPMVAVNVATLTPSLVASELFGHLPGAFTGASERRKGLIHAACGGTLFLDEIGDMPLSVQPSLLRFLEDGQVRPLGSNVSVRVDTRIVCATHRDLRADVEAGRFREDLHHRLAGFVIQIPSLRNRPADLPLLVEEFLATQSPARVLPKAWWTAFRSYPWPGNVRELKNVIRSVCGMSRGPELETRFLPVALRNAIVAPTVLLPEDAPYPYEGWTLQEVERDILVKTLQRHGGHRSHTAVALGISPRALYDKIKRLRVNEAELFGKQGALQ